MNTKQIFDVKKGTSDVDALMLGSKTVWRRRFGEDLPESSELLCFYTAERFSGNTYPQSEGTGKLIDGVSGNTLDVAICRKRTLYRPEQSGVALRSSTFSHSFDDSISRMTFYFRTKVYAYSSRGYGRLKMQTDEGIGFSLAYTNNFIDFYNNTTPTGATIVRMTTDSYAYHTMAISADETHVRLYCDGVFLRELTHKGFGRRIALSINDIDTPIMLQAAAVYSGAHSEQTIGVISDYLNSRFTFTQKADSERIMLYESGNMHEEITGGWVVPDPYSSLSVTFGESSVTLKNVTSSGRYVNGGISTATGLNLSSCRKLYYTFSSPSTPYLTGNLVARGVYFGYMNAEGTVSVSDVCAQQLTTVRGNGEEYSYTLCFDLPDSAAERQAIYPLIYNTGTDAGAVVYAVWAK